MVLSGTSENYVVIVVLGISIAGPVKPNKSHGDSTHVLKTLKLWYLFYFKADLRPVCVVVLTDMVCWSPKNLRFKKKAFSWFCEVKYHDYKIPLVETS